METVYSIVASPNFKNDGICFAACQSGLYKSEDGGNRWYNAFDSLNPRKPLTTTSVAISPAFETDQTVFAAVGGAVLHSTDGGKKWEATVISSPAPYISCLSISPEFEIDGFLIAGTLEDGVFISTDRGKHWKPCNFGLLDLNILCIDISSQFEKDETIYIGTESGIFISKNAGKAWKETNFPPEFGPILSISLSPNYREDGTLFAGTESYGLFKSYNKGNEWIRLGENIISEGINSIILSSTYFQKPEILIASGQKLLISYDDGKTWLTFKNNLQTEDEIICVAAPQGLSEREPILLGLSKGGIIKV